MFRAASRFGAQQVVKTQRRHAGGWFKKNIRVEENAGLREISYRTWEFDAASMARLFFYGVVPSALIYSLVVEENVRACRMCWSFRHLQFFFVQQVLTPFLPRLLRLFVFCAREQVIKNDQIGRHVLYGIVPKSADEN
jgi:hypothetical protein